MIKCEGAGSPEEEASVLEYLVLAALAWHNPSHITVVASPTRFLKKFHVHILQASSWQLRKERTGATLATTNH